MKLNIAKVGEVLQLLEILPGLLQNLGLVHLLGLAISHLHRQMVHRPCHHLRFRTNEPPVLQIHVLHNENFEKYSHVSIDRIKQILLGRRE